MYGGTRDGARTRGGEDRDVGIEVRLDEEVVKNRKFKRGSGEIVARQCSRRELSLFD